MNRHFFARITDFFQLILAMLLFLIVTSDSPYFPYTNFIALVILALITMLCPRGTLNAGGTARPFSLMKRIPFFRGLKKCKD